MSHYALYDRYRELNRKYDEAEAEKHRSERRESSYNSQRKSKNNQLSSKKTQKKNREKRLDGVKKIIKQLDGSAGMFSNDVPEKITKAAKALDKADSRYKESIRVSGGMPVASLETALYIKSVTADSNSAAALTGYKTEKTRVENLIAGLKKEIVKLEDEIASLKRKINSENDRQRELAARMTKYRNEINDLKRQLF